MSEYFIRLARLNGWKEPERVRPVLKPGMGFDSPEKWWGDRGLRQSVHEGLDVCFLEQPDGGISCVGPDFKVPPVSPGTVVRICRDFLGQTVILSHGQSHPDAAELLSLYAHLKADQGIKIQDQVSGEDILGKTVQSNALPDGMRPHVHISLAWNERPLSYAHLEWPRLSRREGVRFLDPLPWIEEGKRMNLQLQSSSSRAKI